MAAALRNNSTIWITGRFFALLFALTAAITAQEVLTNESIVNMTKAHLKEDLILEMIRGNQGRFAVTSSALRTLKQQGVSDAVIAAMWDKMTHNTEAPVVSSKQPTASALPSSSGWKILDTKDQLTGQAGFEAFFAENVNSQGQAAEFEVTATCTETGVLFKIDYLSDPNPGYKLTDLKPNPKVSARAAIDGVVKTFVASVPEFDNEALFLFAPRQADRGHEILSAVFKGLIGISVTDISPDELFKVRDLKIEMPLRNGALPLLEIHPQDPEFQKFGSRCESAGAIKIAKEKEPSDPGAPTSFEASQLKQLAVRGINKQNWASYGPPAITDSYSNLTVKALLTNNAKLTEYLRTLDEIKGVYPVPAGDLKPGVLVPGDIVSPSIDLNSSQVLTVYIRSQARSNIWLAPFLNKEVEIEPTGLAQLRQRRADLMALGVTETRAPAEPDRPSRIMPPSWTTKTWFVCPGTRLKNTDETKGFTEIRAPTEVSIVNHHEGRFQVRLGRSSQDTYDVPFVFFLFQACGPQQYPTRYEQRKQ